MQVEVRETAGKVYVVYRASNGKVIYIGTANDVDNWKIAFYLYRLELHTLRLRQAVKWNSTVMRLTGCEYWDAINMSGDSADEYVNIHIEGIDKWVDQLPDFNPVEIV